MTKTYKIYHARICDFDCYPFSPWDLDGMTPSYEICPKCNVEFGYEDATKIGIQRYWEKYFTAGRKNEGI